MDEEFLGNIMELYEEISLSDKSKVKEIQAENRSRYLKNWKYMYHHL